MTEEIIKELQAIHRSLDEHSKEEYRQRVDMQKNIQEMAARLNELQPVLEVYKTGLSWSTGAMWLTKLFMKVIGGVGVIVGTIIAIKELFKR